MSTEQDTRRKQWPRPLWLEDDDPMPRVLTAGDEPSAAVLFVPAGERDELRAQERERIREALEALPNHRVSQDTIEEIFGSHD